MLFIEKKRYLKSCLHKRFAKAKLMLESPWLLFKLFLTVWCEIQARNQAILFQGMTVSRLV